MVRFLLFVTKRNSDLADSIPKQIISKGTMFNFLFVLLIIANYLLNQFLIQRTEKP